MEAKSQPKCFAFQTVFQLFCQLLQLIPMMDIKEVVPDFQKLNKTENCIVIHLKTDTKVAITSPVSLQPQNFSLLALSRNQALGKNPLSKISATTLILGEHIVCLAGSGAH